MLPELRSGPAARNALTGEYSSAGSVLDQKATAALLRKHRLMPDQVAGRREPLLR